MSTDPSDMSPTSISCEQWRCKWGSKLRDKITRNLSYQKSAPLSEECDSNSRQIGVHQHQPGDGDHITAVSTAPGDSSELPHLQYNALYLQSAASGSYYTACSVLSSSSICQSEVLQSLDDPLPKEEEAALARPLNGYETISSQKHVQTQVQTFCVPAHPDADPPASPSLSSDTPTSRDLLLRQSFVQLLHQSRWIEAGETLRQAENRGMWGAERATMQSSPRHMMRAKEVTEMVQSMACFEESLSETNQYKQNSSEPLQVQSPLIMELSTCQLQRVSSLEGGAKSLRIML
jgi:hypothetical protein